MWAGHMSVQPVDIRLYQLCGAAAKRRGTDSPGPRAGPWAGARRAPARRVGGMSDATPDFDSMTRDIADVPAVEVITTVAVHLMSAAAVNLGLAEEGEAHKDLDEARKLITALAGLVTAGATEISNFHAAPLRDGLKSLQLAFREASVVPDEPGQGPGEKFTGPVYA
ncbi:hypothetical protein GCM10010218_21670 [Streptomyces mashuensis]|uniref:DUF1844 domain-containing protein n=2 Tax=Streptomyces mashuensis TaxID=33904 RepID=A0A919ECL0_9ACTN|nr:hypothetical protein GCM10010218_21670 [Streptomyces mashuensis]